MALFKRLSIFMLAIMMFFETIFSVSAGNSVSVGRRLNPSICGWSGETQQDDIILQQRLSKCFNEYAESSDFSPDYYLSHSLNFYEKLIERDGGTGTESDCSSRTVRMYSLPALFGSTDAQGNKNESALLKDFRSMLKKADLHFKDLKKHVTSDGKNIKEDEIDKTCLEEFQTAATNYAESVSDKFRDPNKSALIKDQAYIAIGEGLGEYLAQRKCKPKWWDRHFHREETSKNIFRYKIEKNIVEVSTLLMFAIEKEEWKYTDENGDIQSKDFLVTATDEAKEEEWNFLFFSGTSIKSDRDLASVKFVKSNNNPPLYEIDANLRRALPQKFKELHDNVLGFLGLFNSDVKDYEMAGRFGQHDILIEDLFNDQHKLEEWVRGITGSIISALFNLDQNERAEFGREWQALLESFNANWSNSQRIQNILGNLRNNMTEARARIVFLHRIVSDLTNEYNNQRQINSDLQRQLAAANERLATLEAHEQMDSNAFRANIEQAYRNGNWIIKRCLKALFPDVLRDIDNVNGRSGLQSVVTQ